MEEIIEYFRVKSNSSNDEDKTRSKAFNAITQVLNEEQRPLIPTSYFAITITAINENLQKNEKPKISNESHLFILSMILQL